MNAYEDFFTALEDAIQRAGNMNRLARLSGVPVNSISRWISRDRSPSLEGIIPLLPFIDWPKRGQRQDPAPTMKRIEPNAPTEAVVGTDLVRIPVMLEAGAGQPVDVFDSDPIRWIEVLPRYYSDKVRAIEVVGDSMEPTIRKGAIVGVKPFEGDLQEGGVYLCRIPYFGLLVKRVKADGIKGMRLISDNQAYDPISVPFEECEGLIVGQIVWCWQGM